MKVHHLTVQRSSCRLGDDRKTHGMVCHCLLIETETGLVLVDTGLGRQVNQHRQAAIGMLFYTTARPRMILKKPQLLKFAMGFRAFDTLF